MKLDEIDIKILNILQNEGRITNTKLASQVGISPPATLDRVKRLEKAGVISKFVALLDRKKLGISILAFVSVSLSVHQLSSLDNFTRSIAELDEVLECYQISGDSDFILKVALKSLDVYSDFLINKLTGIEGIQNIKSTFVLETIKQGTAYLIDNDSKKSAEPDCS